MRTLLRELGFDNRGPAIGHRNDNKPQFVPAEYVASEKGPRFTWDRGPAGDSCLWNTEGRSCAQEETALGTIPYALT